MSKRIFIILIVGSILFLFIQGTARWQMLHDGKLHVVFCDVGQGDGVIIKSPQGKILLFDGGPNASFQGCLSKFTPFWEKDISLILLSHPHLDHFAGYIDILQKYKVESFATEDLTSDQKAYQLFLDLIEEKKVKRQILKIGDSYQVGTVSLEVVGPSQDLLTRTSPGGKIGESKEFASLVVLLRIGEFSLLFTGDSQAQEIEEAVHKFGLKGITVLQSPHHGSSTGLTQEIVEVLHPRLAVISVGAKNRYGHPSASTLKLFEGGKIPIKRTDRDGTIEIVTDGKAFSVL